MECLGGVPAQAVIDDSRFWLIEIDRVGAGKIDKPVFRPATDLSIDRAARDVGCMRSKSTELIEEGGLANIRLAHQSDGLAGEVGR